MQSWWDHFSVFGSFIKNTPTHLRKKTTLKYLEFRKYIYPQAEKFIFWRKCLILVGFPWCAHYFTYMIGNQSLKCARNRLTMWSFSSKRISSKTLSKVENFEELDSSFAGKMRKRKFYFKNATSGSGLVHRRLRTIVLFAPRGNILSLVCAQRQCIAGSGYAYARAVV